MPKSTELIAEESRELRLQLKAFIDSGMSKQKALVKLLPKDSNRARKLKVWEKEGLFPIPEAELRAFEQTGETTEESQTVAPQTTKQPETVALETTVIEDKTAQHDEPESAHIEETPEWEPAKAESETVAPQTTKQPETVAPLKDANGSAYLAQTLVQEPPKAPEPETVAPDTTVKEESMGGLDQENLLRLIDQRAGKVVENRLKGMVADLYVAEKAPAGAGRGHKGKTHVKFNVSIPAELNEALEALGGVKSQHVSHAIRIYLQLLENSKTRTTKTTLPFSD